MFKVTLSNGVEFNCSPDQTILDAASGNSIALEHSCRTGRCGVCVAGVKAGESTSLITEEFIVSDDADDFKILTCCRTPASNLLLDIQDLGAIGLLNVLTLPCRVSSLKFVLDDVCCLRLRLPPNNNFLFMPGQYIDVIKGDTRRSYSIANAPGDDGQIELQIKKVVDGVMSDYFFNHATNNDLLRLEGPFGTFSYRSDKSKNIVLMATGTGIAPLKALLESFGSALPGKKIFLVWGGRYEQDLYLDFEKIGVEFVYIPVLSRVSVEGFSFGYVQHAVLDIGLDLSDTTVYACGSVTMINSACELLVENGLSLRDFHSDAFVSSN